LIYTQLCEPPQTLISEINVVQELCKLGYGAQALLSEASVGPGSIEDVLLRDVRPDWEYGDSTIRLRTGKTSIPAVLRLSRELGWFIGLFIAEGCFETTINKLEGEDREVPSSTISLVCDRASVDRAAGIVAQLGLTYAVSEDGTSARLRVFNKLFSILLSEILGLGLKSRFKALPKGFLSYDQDFLEGLISGIIDGDGCIKSSPDSGHRISVRVSSKSLCCQLRDALNLLGIPSSLGKPEGAGSTREFKGRTIVQNFDITRLEFGLTEDAHRLLQSSRRIRDIDGFRAAGKSLKDSPGVGPCSIYRIDDVSTQDPYVYDVTTGSGTFLCSGIWTHNCGAHSLEYVKKHGLALENLDMVSKPAKHAQTLIGHLNTYIASMQAFFAGAMGFGFVNIFLAPYLVGKSDGELKQLAQYMIFSISQNAFARGGQTVFSDFGVNLSIPDYLKETPAIGPGGKYTGKTYAAYEKEAQRFAKALLMVWGEGDGAGVPFTFPTARIHIDESTFTDPSQKELFDYACLVSSKNGSPYFVFDRESTRLAQCCRLSFDFDPEDMKHPEGLRLCGFQNISLNLPQCAYRAGKGKLDKLYKNVERVITLAIKAHLQKKKVSARYMSKPGMPLWQLGKDAKDGKPLIDLENATYIVGLVGLNECLQYMLGQELHESDEVLKEGLKLVNHMAMFAKKLGKEHDLKVSLEESPAESAIRRLAKIDLRNFHDAAMEVMKGDVEGDQAFYTNSIHLNPAAPVNLWTRIKDQSRFHRAIESGAIIHCFVGAERPSAVDIEWLVKKTFDETNCSQLVISPETSYCYDCRAHTPGIVKRCSNCGSENVFGLSRIVGYCSKIERWNRSKLGELKARQEGDYSIGDLKCREEGVPVFGDLPPVVFEKSYPVSPDLLKDININL
jgi:anaerobic ribonucleoside-triphosphate reductase